MSHHTEKTLCIYLWELCIKLKAFQIKGVVEVIVIILFFIYIGLRQNSLFCMLKYMHNVLGGTLAIMETAISTSNDAYYDRSAVKQTHILFCILIFLNTLYSLVLKRLPQNFSIIIIQKLKEFFFSPHRLFKSKV